MEAKESPHTTDTAGNQIFLNGNVEHKRRTRKQGKERKSNRLATTTTTTTKREQNINKKLHDAYNPFRMILWWFWLFV